MSREEGSQGQNPHLRFLREYPLSWPEVSLSSFDGVCLHLNEALFTSSLRASNLRYFSAHPREF